MNAKGKVLLYGCSGALGKNLSKLYTKYNWNITGCDYTTNLDIQSCLTIPKNISLSEQADYVNQFLKVEIGSKDHYFDAIVCASGGFAFGNCADPDFISKSKSMISCSIDPSLICAHMASKYLKNNGLLVLPGAAVAFEPNGFLLGYSASKAYVHYMVKSLANEGAGMPTSSTVVGIAPVTLDTENNRNSMPYADKSSWTPLDEVSKQILAWSADSANIKNGTIFKFITENGITRTEPM